MRKEFEKMVLAFIQNVAAKKDAAEKEHRLLPAAILAIEPSVAVETQLESLVVRLIQEGLTGEREIPAEVMAELLKAGSKIFFGEGKANFI